MVPYSSPETKRKCRKVSPLLYSFAVFGGRLRTSSRFHKLSQNFSRLGSSLYVDTGRISFLQNPRLCSVHFEDSCFERRPTALSEESEFKFKRFLIKGSTTTRDTEVPYSSPETKRKR